MDSQLTNRPLSSLSIPPSTLSALIRDGYETVHDLDTSNPEKLANASAVASSSGPRIVTNCSPIDKLLGGGLPRRHVLEISGPPGTPKAAIAVGIVKSFLKCSSDEEILFLGERQHRIAGCANQQQITDIQNMTRVSALRRVIPPDATKRVFHHILHTLPELVVFIHTLPSILASRPKLGLLVLSSLHFPLQASKKLSIPAKNTVLQNIKQALVQLTARGVTIVVTTQMATKVLAADGSPATFDTGARAVMVPQLGPAYLPSANSFRVLICPQARDSGYTLIFLTPDHGLTDFSVFRLLSDPSKSKQGATLKEEPYTIVCSEPVPVPVPMF
ncbi:hypothetical protein B0H12DRAFT_1235160 [Mycena haematopus]|nr:hypothetical protein B0H12DRAFT_1235160 [Mycena haematopus]